MPRWWNASLLACVACSSEDPDTTIDRVFDPCAPITLSSPATEARSAAVREAFALWGLAGTEAGVGVGDQAIGLVFQSAAAAFKGLYDDEHAVIYINDKITDPRALAIVIAHELGHAMGLPHVTGEPSLMNPNNTTLPPTAADADRIRALWGACTTSSSAPPGT